MDPRLLFSCRQTSYSSALYGDSPLEEILGLLFLCRQTSFSSALHCLKIPHLPPGERPLNQSSDDATSSGNFPR